MILIRFILLVSVRTMCQGTPPRGPDLSEPGEPAMVKPRAWLQQYRLSFYFDYISPYAYFAHRRLNLPPTHPRSFFRGLREGSNIDLQIEYKPVLLAGLLKHWGQLGPAEIASKRVFTYEYTHWLGRRQEGLPDFQFPHSHPFNSLPLLRASVACGNDPQMVERIFRYVWADGCIPTDRTEFQALLASLGLSEANIETSAVKEALKQNTEEAVGAGVFGVPTLAISAEGPSVGEPRLFWGNDALSFAHDFLLTTQHGDAGGDGGRAKEEARAVFEDAKFTRLAELPVAASRVAIKK